MNKEKDNIMQSVETLLKEVPEEVTIVAIADGHSQEDVEVTIESGITNIGYHDIQNAEPVILTLGKRARWHMIGRVKMKQSKKIVQLFEMVETMDSWKLAKRLDRHGRKRGKILPVLIEIKGDLETSERGIALDEIDDLFMKLSTLQFVRVEGLMSMGQESGDPEDNRKLFRATREAFERLSDMNLQNSLMRYLSMGRSNNYPIALEEGANIIHIDTKNIPDQEQG